MSRPRVAVVIPARMGSSRFPGKPLAQILGLPMIEHVRRRVEKMKCVDEVYVATCDEEIRSLVESHGGRAIMTSSRHERATDRIEEAAHQIQADVIVNVQGDEPMVSEKSLEEVTSPFLKSPETYCTCLIYPIENLSELSSPNIVKAVLSQSHKILYLSRATIPGKEIQKNFRYYKQSGIMAYRKDFLHRYSKLPPTPLEAKESVDILRILENDLEVQGVVSLEETKGVDIPEQIAEVEKAILADARQKSLFEEIRS